jgi:hypothetical protein
MKKHLIALLTAMLLVTSCATSVTNDIKVEAEADPTIKFSGYKTYAWLGSASIVYDPAGKWEPPQFDADTEIKFLIDGELRKRGLSEDTANPELIVAFAAGIDMTAMREEVDPKSNISALQNVPEGALTVVLVDALTGLAVWGGVATADIQQDPDAEVVKKRLAFAVSSMFKQLPK